METQVASGVAQSRRRSGGLSRREAVEGYLFVLPWVVGLLVFTLFPVVAGFLMGFTEYQILLPPRWVGLDNYRQIVTDDPQFWTALYNTAYYVVFAVPSSMVVGLLLALLLNSKIWGIALFRTALYVPAIVPILASVALWTWLFHDQFGLVNLFLSSWGIEGPHWFTSPYWTKPTLILWNLWHVGAGTIIYLAGLQGIPLELYEAAEIDGANRWRRFWAVTIPMLSPTIFFVLIIGIIGSFQIFDAAFVMGWGYRTASAGPLDSLLFYVLYIYHNGFFFFRMGYAAALAWILFVIILAFTLVQFWVAGRWVYYELDAKK